MCVHVVQPRRQNISTFEISKDDLYRWADEVLKPTAELAFAGDGNFLCGEWCGFCKAKNECRARAEANLELARYDFKLPPLLTDEDIEDILSRVDALVSWASDIKEYALQQAVSGKEWHGWKLVEGRSNRRYTNEAAVIQTVSDAGFDPYERKLLGITAMQKLLGKARFDELLTAYIEKPQGKPTLVPESDKRPAMNTAKNDFTSSVITILTELYSRPCALWMDTAYATWKGTFVLEVCSSPSSSALFSLWTQKRINDLSSPS